MLKGYGNSSRKQLYKIIDLGYTKSKCRLIAWSVNRVRSSLLYNGDEVESRNVGRLQRARGS